MTIWKRYKEGDGCPLCGHIPKSPPFKILQPRVRETFIVLYANRDKWLSIKEIRSLLFNKKFLSDDRGAVAARLSDLREALKGTNYLIIKKYIRGTGRGKGWRFRLAIYVNGDYGLVPYLMEGE